MTKKRPPYPRVKECQRIVPRVLGVKVLHPDIADRVVSRLADLRPSVRRAETPALAVHRGLPQDIAVLDHDVLGVQAKRAARLSRPADALKQNVAGPLEVKCSGEGITTTFGLDAYTNMQL